MIEELFYRPDLNFPSPQGLGGVYFAGLTIARMMSWVSGLVLLADVAAVSAPQIAYLPVIDTVPAAEGGALEGGKPTAADPPAPAIAAARSRASLTASGKRPSSRSPAMR
jgi:hypothetical protein